MSTRQNPYTLTPNGWLLDGATPDTVVRYVAIYLTGFNGDEKVTRKVGVWTPHPDVADEDIPEIVFRACNRVDDDEDRHFGEVHGLTAVQRRMNHPDWGTCSMSVGDYFVVRRETMAERDTRLDVDGDPADVADPGTRYTCARFGWDVERLNG